MAFIRSILVSIVAPVVACVAVSLGIGGMLDDFTFVPLPFALFGSLLLLAPAHAGLMRRGVATGVSYAVLLLVGSGCGALMLGVLTRGRMDGFVWGGMYGAATATVWVVLHVLGGWVFGPAEMSSR